jgi:hypothetical protein
MLLCARFTKKFSPSITSMGWQQQQQQQQAAAGDMVIVHNTEYAWYVCIVC